METIFRWFRKGDSSTPFYTSYKGWKLNLLLSVYGTEGPFYTSYKGWKHNKRTSRSRKRSTFLYFL